MNNYPAPRPHIPIGLIAGAIITSTLLIGGVVAWLAVSTPWLLIALFGLAGAAGVARLWASVVVLMRRNSHRYIQAEHVTHLTLAQRSQGLPQTIQSLNYHDSHRVEAPPQLALTEPMEGNIVLPSIPTFAQLLEQGLIGKDRPLILGYDAVSGQAITGSWKDLYSCGVGAQQGAGKTWLLAFLLAQSAAAGGRLIVCDLHAGDDESLTNRIAGLAPAFMCDVASTPKAIAAALAFADDKLERRKTNTARWPIVLVCDEWTSLLRTPAGPMLTPHIQNIAEQGRKFNVNGLLAAQAWTKAASSDVRNQLTSHYVLRQRPDEARYQLGMRAAQIPDDVRSLPDATAYFLNVKGELAKVIIPHMTAADVARVGEMIDRPAASGFGFQAPTAPLPVITAEAGRKRVGSGSAEAASTALQPVRMTSPEAIRAAALFQAKMSEKAIVKELRGVDGGRNYEAARDEVRNLILEGLLGGQR